MNNRALKHIGRVFNKLGVWLICIVLFIILAISTDTFLGYSNLINVVRQISVMAIVALGASFIVMAGEIDLSQTPMVALSGCVCAKLMVEANFSIPVAILFSLIIGLFIGLCCGAVIALLNVPSFITTMGAQYVLAGVVLLVTQSQPTSGLPDAFLFLGRGYVGFIPVPTIILAIVFFMGWFVFKYLQFGRNVLAVGENAKAAELSGINVIKTRILVFGLGGVASALGGVVLAARLGSGQPSSGVGVSLQCLAAVFIGGTTSGNVLNTLAGAFLIGMINNGLNLMKIDSAWQDCALGVIIIGAVAINIIRSKKIVSSVK